MAIEFRSMLGKGLLVVFIATALSGCKTPKAEKEQTLSAPGQVTADSPQQVKSARDFVSSLQQALKQGDRSRVTGMMRLPIQVGEGYDTVPLDESQFNRDYDKVWNPATVKAVMNENPDYVAWEPGALAEPIGCGEVWFEKTKDGRFRISGFDISRFRSAGMSIEDCYRVRAFVVQLQAAVAGDSREQVAGMLKYPLYFHGQSKTITLHNVHETLRNYDLVFSDKLRRAVAEQQIWNLGSMTNGVAIGYGFIWISEPNENGPLKVTSISEPPLHY